MLRNGGWLSNLFFKYTINSEEYNKIFVCKTMQDQSAVSSLSNMSFINCAKNQKHSEFMCKFLDTNIFGDTYREPQVKEVECNDKFLFSPMRNFSPKGNSWFLEKCWPLEEKQMEKEENNEQIPHLDLEPQKEEPKPVKKRGKKPKKENAAKETKRDSAKSEELLNQVPVSKSKNQTKNIPKNFGKAIITFIEKERETIQEILDDYGVCYQTLLAELTEKKKLINTIANLRQLWVSDKNSECLRMISGQFLRKYSLNYIFNSRICNYISHIKYRRRLLEAIECPNSFKHIKDY